MRPVLYLFTTVAVMVLAFWAYRENYRTQAALTQMEAVQRQIGTLREDLGVLRAEWAYLNRPARLRELVNMNFDRLGLVPFGAEQFVDVGQIAFAPPRRPVTAEGPAWPGPAAMAGSLPATPAIRPPGFPPLRPQERTP